jgi:hypothetical protein
MASCAQPMPRRAKGLPDRHCDPGTSKPADPTVATGQNAPGDAKGPLARAWSVASTSTPGLASVLNDLKVSIVEPDP